MTCQKNVNLSGRITAFKLFGRKRRGVVSGAVAVLTALAIDLGHVLATIVVRSWQCRSRQWSWIVNGTSHDYVRQSLGTRISRNYQTQKCKATGATCHLIVCHSCSTGSKSFTDRTFDPATNYRRV